MYLLRSILVWFLIIFVEIIHGTVRQLFLAPVVGDFPARRIAVFTGMILIFLVTLIFIRRIDAPDNRSLFLIGFIWVFLTVLFEFSLGIFVFNFSWTRLMEDYNIARGGLMAFGLLFLFFAPYLADRLRNKQ
ncbi:MAG: hypothetical protein KIS76_11205 [Pyrinomonadaceae bacterium]|nr:hypothetical protein [Pyrinomonadaceae bacterium]